VIPGSVIRRGAGEREVCASVRASWSRELISSFQRACALQWSSRAVSPIPGSPTSASVALLPARARARPDSISRGSAIDRAAWPDSMHRIGDRTLTAQTRGPPEARTSSLNVRWTDPVKEQR
jgi:hypothetical protein